MRVIYNDTEKEIFILKHFQLMDEEYILYKNLDSISIGKIDGNQIIVPNQERLSSLMSVLSSFFNGLQDDSIVLLDNNIDETLVEIGYQNVSVTEEQFNNLINKKREEHVSKSVENVSHIQNKKPKLRKERIIIILAVLGVLILIGLGFVFKDKLFNLKRIIPITLNNKTAKKIEDVEIINGLSTYAVKTTFGSPGEIYEYYENIIRYDKNGNFKYYEYTDNIVLDKVEETKNKSDKELKKLFEEEKKEKLSKMENLNYAGFKVVFELQDRIYKVGYVFTDESISAGILNSNPKDQTLMRMLNDYKDFENEEILKEKLENLKEELSSRKEELLIIDNKKVQLDN